LAALGPLIANLEPNGGSNAAPVLADCPCHH
jgi:hypothetical protein